MKNTCLVTDTDERIKIIEDYIQILVNSGHTYPYIKAVILQGLTKYQYLLERSQKESVDKTYMPLCREMITEGMRESC